MPLPHLAPDGGQPLDVGIGHELTAHIAAGHKGKFFLQAVAPLQKLALQPHRVHAGHVLLPVVQFRVAPQHLKAHAHLMDAVVERLQLGRLVDDVLGAGDLATVVQPRAQAEFVALGIRHGDVGKWTFLGLAQALHQGFRQLGHPLAVAAGVRALGVDRVGQQADDGIEQLLLPFDQTARLDGDRQRAREFLDKRPEVDIVLLLVRTVAQHQQAQRLAVARA